MTPKLGSHVTILILIIHLHFIVSSTQSDKEILLKFKESLKNTGALSLWDNNNNKPPCEGDYEIWNGVLCEKGSVWGLQLENMGLGGVIDVDTLVGLKNLRAISFMNNNFDGKLPDLTKLGALRSIYLTSNQFSGEIPGDMFSALIGLKKIYLGNNKFSGPIPGSLASLPKLKELEMENNQFEGGIPDFSKEHLKVFNVSNNRLEGQIPTSLSHIDASAFSGNKDLCGAPLKSCTSPSKVSTSTIIILSILVAAALAALVAVVIILRRRKNQPPDYSADRKAIASTDLDKMEQGGQTTASSASSSPDHMSKKSEQSVKLTFLQEDMRDKFDMSDLLKASAEILGSGVFGSTYKAALNEGTVMVVKRFRHMNNVSREEFNEHMRRLGRLNHQNVLSIVGFYYRKEEKLLVTNFAHNGSLAVHLHGNKSRGLPSPDWPTRLKIIKGVAKGLKYLYIELPSLTAPHGHLKSSNVLLDKSFNPLLTDYGLVPVTNQEHAQQHMISYKSPEYKQNGRITKKTDIWSLGILILEILTGRFPSNFLQEGRGGDTDIVTWVESIMRDDDDSHVEVFDGDMKGILKSCEGEMMKLLRIGLKCCVADVDRRMDVKDVLEKIEEIKERDNGEDEFYSSYASEGDMRSSRGLSDDFNVTFT
ncbi:hypothetical protein RD792_010939 [Penstemon davidsonii]|uniref:Protein kinase domain-containing protein n=1 Tax=Penstemon davidsonii TaxID=160366 RepID=A0ABR0D3E3_9LAMI|nr:hypothetical protein RD792_010939 [Penstemon davidsonii]